MAKFIKSGKVGMYRLYSLSGRFRLI
ncbi:unnamed protein product [Kuraishia capsulata CBS 1993]|uniref:Uncharacterized protein n=1 Tax=Kuraishia capsulata CBS 1993 TaxID=1382522 RepID=W6MQC8_9ASCO|nr:unnamed protein product [Kuraishia capsulata CBS 1993]